VIRDKSCSHLHVAPKPSLNIGFKTPYLMGHSASGTEIRDVEINSHKSWLVRLKLMLRAVASLGDGTYGMLGCTSP
jgi:predicted transcriptional regulator